MSQFFSIIFLESNNWHGGWTSRYYFHCYYTFLFIIFGLRAIIFLFAENRHETCLLDRMSFHITNGFKGIFRLFLCGISGACHCFLIINLDQRVSSWNYGILENSRVSGLRWEYYSSGYIISEFELIISGGGPPHRKQRCGILLCYSN